MRPKSIIVQRTLYDIRDQKSYTIAKLPDGNCWMTQNLALGSTEGSMTLTSSDSNVSSSFVLPQAQATSGSEEWSDAANSANSTHVYTQSEEDYGNLYNWYTATAGTGLGTLSSASATDLTNATDSICPKGWRLPDGGASTSKSFFQLDKVLGGNGSNRIDASQRDKLIAAPYSFPYFGYYNYAGGLNQGSAGYWWSRSASTTAGRAYGLDLHTSGDVGPQDSSSVGYGFSVRCVADSDFWGISTMQEMTPTVCASATTPSADATSVDTDGSHAGDSSYVPQSTLYDIRDGESYRIRKLADGNCWMTENLRLELSSGSYLEPAFTDVTSQVAVGASSETATSTKWSDIGFNNPDESTKSETNTWHSYSGVKNQEVDGYAPEIGLSSTKQKRGVFYNFYTATATSGNWDNVGVAPNSLCPKKWQLPNYTGDKSWQNLIHGTYNLKDDNMEDANKLQSFPISFIRAGYRPSEVAGFGTEAGLSWTNRSLSSHVAAFLWFPSNHLSGQGANSNLYGLSIRCVAR